MKNILENSVAPTSKKEEEKPSRKPNNQTIENNSTCLINSLISNNPDEPLSIMSLLGAQNNVPLSIDTLFTKVHDYEDSKCSSKSLPLVRAYAANTHQGVVRY